MRQSRRFLRKLWEKRRIRREKCRGKSPGRKTPSWRSLRQRKVPREIPGRKRIYREKERQRGLHRKKDGRKIRHRRKHRRTKKQREIQISARRMIKQEQRKMSLWKGIPCREKIQMLRMRRIRGMLRRGNLCRKTMWIMWKGIYRLY